MGALETAKKSAVIVGDPLSRILLIFIAGVPGLGQWVNSSHDQNKEEALQEAEGGGGAGHSGH